jgi:preprotein translocase subunit SecF
MSFEEFYMKNYKKILIIPLILLLGSILILASQKVTNGQYIDKDVTLKGGISAEIFNSQEVNIEEIEFKFLEQFQNSDISVRISSNGFGEQSYIIETTETSSAEVVEFLKQTFNVTENEMKIRITGARFGQSSFQGLISALIFALILMGIVVFITFRKLIPSLAVIFSAILDLVGTLAVISLLDFKLSTAGIAAFLMVVGYSIDTDILLTTRLLKGKMGTIYERTKRAFKTGITMTLTTIIALSVAAIFTVSATFRQMFSIIIIALIIDLISTWCMNSGLLIWYLEKNENN